MVSGKRPDSVHLASQAWVDWMYQESTPCWILSTGRAGSSWLAGLLALSENLDAHHEATPRLQELPNQAFHRQDQGEWLEGVVRAARSELVLSAVIQGRHYIECNHTLTPFAPALSRVFRKSRFVHLSRHPGDFIRSALRMGFHQSDTVWEMGRIRMADENAWNGLEPLQKLAWYWKACNEFIEDFGNKLGPERFLTLSYEQLASKPEALEQLWQFVGAAEVEEEAIANVRSEKVNTVRLDVQLDSVQRTSHFPVFACWEPAQREQVVALVEEPATRMGYSLTVPQVSEYPLLSVVVPNRNGASYLAACLDSILKQTYPRLQILVVDDASDDDSRELVEGYAHRFEDRLKLCRLEHRVGVARARNQGIELAAGHYLSTLDSDDFYIDSRKLEAEFQLAEGRSSPGRRDAIGFSDIILADPDGALEQSQWPESDLREGDIFEGLLTRSVMIPRDFVAPRAAYLEVGGYRPEFSTHEDWDIKIRLARKFRFYFTGLAGTAYRRHGSGLSSVSIWIRMANLWSVFEDNLESWASPERHATLKECFQRFMSEIIENSGLQCDSSNSLERAELMMYKRAAQERLQLIQDLENVCRDRLALIESQNNVIQGLTRWHFWKWGKRP